VIYVNNGFTNFQSLAFQQAVHIHVNHGESDKICMVSNQAKAYDKVFVAGEAAIARHRAALAWFDAESLVKVGRPQLDLDVPNALPAFTGTTITYAPTWEGEDQVNNYTSVDCYGPQLVQGALQQPGARVVYKPHPRVIDADDPQVRRNHRLIVDLIEQAGSPHVYLPDANILGVLRQTDVLICDVSSVSLDHLYLRPDAHLLLTDRRSNRAQLLADTPIAAASTIIDATSIEQVAQNIGRHLDDTQVQRRLELRDYYFDGLAPGESTARFWRELNHSIHEHDVALQELSRRRMIEDA